MSLQQKVLLGFLVSAACIAALAGVLFENFVQIKRETRFLEETDSVRSTSLQLRRHEKNFLLYAPAGAGEEVAAIRTSLAQLEELLGAVRLEHAPRTEALDALVAAYGLEFDEVLGRFDAAMTASAALRAAAPGYGHVAVLVESNFLSQPREGARYLREVEGLAAGHPFLGVLAGLEIAIADLRRTGEEILTESKALDRAARANVDRFIDHSRRAIFLLGPIALVLGIGTLLVITTGTVRRLSQLAGVVERAGAGHFLTVPEGGDDEVGTLIHKFNVMEERLAERERELLRSKKLAAIGTLASGVAHELNNPLSNISTTAQRLLRKSSGDVPPPVRRGLEEIRGQTLRVASIVGDLLEFARGREPRHASVELVRLLRAAWEHLGAARTLDDVGFAITAEPPEIVLEADPEQLERVFINLFANAVDAMAGGGEIAVHAEERRGLVRVRVADTGPGIAEEDVEKLFEPFFTTKDKGTGLGLAIVFNIVAKHGGRILVEGAPGGGASFTVEIPLRAGGGEAS